MTCFTGTYTRDMTRALVAANHQKTTADIHGAKKLDATLGPERIRAPRQGVGHRQNAHSASWQCMSAQRTIRACIYPDFVTLTKRTQQSCHVKAASTLRCLVKLCICGITQKSDCSMKKINAKQSHPA